MDKKNKIVVGMVAGFCLLSIPALLRCGFLQSAREVMLKNCSNLPFVNSSEVVAKLDENYSYDGCVYALKEYALEAELTECKDKDVTKIEMPKFVEKNGKQYRVTIIGLRAFDGCKSLKSIKIPESVERIDACIFNENIVLKKIKVDEGNRNYKSIDGVLFSKDGKTLVRYPSGKVGNNYTIPEGVKSIEIEAFSCCKNLKSLTIPESIEFIYYSIFNESMVLEEIKVDEGNKNYKSIDGVLFFKDGKTLVRYPSGKVGNSYTIQEGVEKIHPNAFYGCKNLKSITMPESLESIGEEDFGAIVLEEIKVDEGNRNYKSIDGVLFSKDGKTLVRYPSGKVGNNYTIPEGVESIGGSAFDGCKNLKSLTIPESIEFIYNSIFNESIVLEEFKVDESNRNYKSIDGVLFSKDGKTLVCYPVGKVGNNYTIPKGVEKITPHALDGCKNLKSITIPESLESIDACIFDNSIVLEEIKVDEGNKNYKSIDGVLFSKDGKTLVRYPVGKVENNYTIPEGVEKINPHAFDGCKSLKSIKIPESVRSIDGAFFNCESLETITLPTSLKSIVEGTFMGCKSLKSITIPEGVEVICNETFSGCESLEIITLPTSLKSIGDMAFSGCESLKSITIPKGVEEICLTAINMCIGLEEIKVDEGNRNYKSIDGVLFSKDGKTLVWYPVGKVGNNYTIPEGVEEIDYSAFTQCGSLETITLPASLKGIGERAFACYGKLKEFRVDESNRNYKSIDGVLFSKDGKTLIKYPVGKVGNNYTIPKGVEKINSDAFIGCENLKSITIPEGVQKIDYGTFRYCENLETITLPTSLKSIGDYVFDRCECLKSITLPKGVESIDDHAFDDTSLNGRIMLEEIKVDESNRNYKSIDGVLFSKDGKTLVRYPSGKVGNNYTIPEGVESIKREAFRGCKNLKSITMPESLESINAYIFDAIVLEEIKVDEGNKNYKSIDGVLFFKDGKNLVRYPSGKVRNNYTIPEGVESIGGSAFYGCKNLKSITLPTSLKSIGDMAFSGCGSLKSIKIPKGAKYKGILDNMRLKDCQIIEI